MNKTALVSSLLVSLAAACNKQETRPTEAQTTSTDQQRAAQTNGTQSALTSDDRDFVTKAAKANMFEVKLGGDAAQKGTKPEVKTFAQHLVNDHGKSNQELAQIAAKKGLTLPTELDDQKKRKLDDFSKLGGPKYDKEFADDMVDDHEEDVKLFEKASRDLKDPELRAFAAKTLPTLQHHLAMAKELKAKTD